MVPHVRSGKLKALGVSGAQAQCRRCRKCRRSPKPACRATRSSNWWGILAPAGTPAPVLDRLYKEIAAILDPPETRKRFELEGAEVVRMKPAEFATFVAQETAKWTRVVKEAGIKAGVDHGTLQGLQAHRDARAEDPRRVRRHDARRARSGRRGGARRVLGRELQGCAGGHRQGQDPAPAELRRRHRPLRHRGVVDQPEVREGRRGGRHRLRPRRLAPRRLRAVRARAGRLADEAAAGPDALGRDGLRHRGLYRRASPSCAWSTRASSPRAAR